MDRPIARSPPPLIPIHGEQVETTAAAVSVAVVNPLPPAIQPPAAVQQDKPLPLHQALKICSYYRGSQWLDKFLWKYDVPNNKDMRILHRQISFMISLDSDIVRF